MRLLVLGGTAWLGHRIASTALDRGHRVSVLARGESGSPPEGASLVRADRTAPGAYDEVAGQDWDAVVDVARQPGQVRSALAALSGRTRHWGFVSSCSVYADHDAPGADESAPLLPAVEGDEARPEAYGEGKVACEQAVLEARGAAGALVARAGLIAGPGDPTDRTGYWPLRLAHPAADDGSVLVPDTPITTQVVDVRDLADWLVRCAEDGVTGTMNASGPQVPLAEHLAVARELAGHRGELVPVSPAWLTEQGVQPWSGPRSLPLWLPLPEYAGFMARDTSAAQTAGLACRPLAESLEDVLAWEVQQGPERPRRAGLAPQEERDLLVAARAISGAG
jgi:nucleoside-diphosphate-sugar epimerase